MTDKPMTEKAIAKAEGDLSNLEQQRETLFHRAKDYQSSVNKVPLRP
jgi:hypothetical protein